MSSKTSDSISGSDGSASGQSWTPVERRDTTPEAALAQQRAWLALEPTRRLEIWLERRELLQEYRRQQLGERYPDEDEARIGRRLLEQTYPGEFTEARLDLYEARLRDYLAARAVE
jgi:hypothetical protein